jgi:hypothetical protein
MQSSSLETINSFLVLEFLMFSAMVPAPMTVFDTQYVLTKVYF